MLRAGADVSVEDVPVPQPAIATEVELAGANPADRHPDLGEVRAAIDLAFAAGRE